MPDRPSERQLAPWEAVLAQALQQDEPERTALEVIQSAQDWSTNTRAPPAAAPKRSGTWTSCRRSTRWSASGSARAEYERYLHDPERPAFLQALREHEIGGRRIEDVLDSITAEPMTGSAASPRDSTAGREKSRPGAGHDGPVG